MEDFQVFLGFLKKHYYTFSGLIVGGLFAFLIVVIPVNEFLSGFNVGTTLRGAVYCGLTFFWVIVWIFLRGKLNKTTKGNVGIVVAINAENEKQKNRIKIDLCEKLRDTLTENCRSVNYELLVLSDYKAEIVSGVLKAYNKKKNYYRRSGLDEHEKTRGTKEEAEFVKIKDKTKAKFFIFGNIIERNRGENNYFIETNIIITDVPVHDNNAKTIQMDLDTIYPRQCNFKEKDEYDGFRIAAELVHISVLYFSGLAAFFSGDPVLAVEHHSGVKKFLNKISGPLPPNLVYIKKRVESLLLKEKTWVAHNEYYINKNYDEAKKILEEFLVDSKRGEDHYNALIFSGFTAFKDEGNPQKSLRIFHEAGKCSHGDLEWMYNIAFLMMYLGKFETAMKYYKKLFIKTWGNEDKFIKECIDNNIEFYKGDSSKGQLVFLIGMLYHRKLCNYQEAMRYYNDFLSKYTDDGYKYLRAVCASYISEINRRH